MSKVRIRGIYSESLSQIMLQNHYEIVQPTPSVARRFGLPVKTDIPDIDVWDRSDLQGIVAIAYEDVLMKLTDILRRRLGWVITRTPRVAKSSIYRGSVIGRDNRTGQTRVDLGTISALLPDRGLKRGEKVMVQVRAHDYGRKAPVLSSNITIPGKTAVLLPEPVVRLSTKIKDQETRKNLTRLGNSLRKHTGNWGILWRTAAVRLTEEELREGVEDLLDIAHRIYREYDDSDDIELLFEGTSNADIEFSAEVKEALDKTRSKLRPTINHHHFFKSAGYGALVDLTEMVIEERPKERSYMTSKLEMVVNNDLPKINDSINIEHVKLDGRNIILSKGRVIDINADCISVRRQFRHTSRKLKMTNDYPDNEVPHDHGDYAITKVVPGSMILVTDYFSRTGTLKGRYVNINTGTELYPGTGTSPGRIRYIDLEIDVIDPMHGDVRIIDQHLLKRAIQRGFITEKMADIARRKAKIEYQKIIAKQN